jgi:hypothetical protein
MNIYNLKTTKMKNLWEKLNEKTKSAINADEENYPNLVSGIKKRLQSNYFAGDVILNDAIRVFTYGYGVHEPFSELAYRNLFE